MLAFVAAILALGSAAAFAVPQASLANTPLEVQVWPGGETGYTLFIVTGLVPEDVPLPATVRLPLPEGAELLWSGEILGDSVSGDVERPATVVQAQGGSAVELTAEATRTVQYEAVGMPLTVDGDFTTSVFEWLQTAPTGEISFSVRVPTAAAAVRIDPDPVGSPRVNAAGERLYAMRPAVLQVGETFSITTQYGAQGAVDGVQERPALLTILLGLLAAALLALAGAVIAGSRHRTS